MTVSFVAQLILAQTGIELASLLALTYDLDLTLLYRIVTYPLVEVPGNVLGRALGLIFAYLMLAQHEARNGAKATIAIAVAGTLGAALLCLPVGLVGFATPLVGLSPLLWAPIGRMLVDVGEQPVQIFSFQLPNARAAAAVLLLLPAGSALFNHDITPVLEAVGAGVAGFLLGMRGLRTSLTARSKKARPRKHPFQVIRGGRDDDDDERPKWLN
jgi:hypothetical protein